MSIRIIEGRIKTAAYQKEKVMGLSQWIVAIIVPGLRQSLKDNFRGIGGAAVM